MPDNSDDPTAGRVALHATGSPPLRRVHPGPTGRLDPACVSCTDPSGDPSTLAVSDHWKVVIHPDQTAPGSLLLVARRHVARISDLTDAEGGELLALYARVERGLEDGLGATLVNLSCLRNWAYRIDDPDPPFRDGRPNPHVHWHVTPRYERPTRVLDTIYTDERFGHELRWIGRRLPPDQLSWLTERLVAALALDG